MLVEISEMTAEHSFESFIFWAQFSFYYLGATFHCIEDTVNLMTR